MWLKNILRILLVLILLGSILMVYVYIPGKDAETNLMLGEHHVLVLAADPSEPRPGMGGIDMAFVVTVVDGDIKNMTAVYPGGMAHPTAAAPLSYRPRVSRPFCCTTPSGTTTPPRMPNWPRRLWNTTPDSTVTPWWYSRPKQWTP